MYTMKRSYLLLFSIAILVVLLISIHFTGRKSAEFAGDGVGGGYSSLSEELPDTSVKEKKTERLFYTAYSVKEGDMVSTIAASYGVSQDAVISINKLRNTRTLQIGQILKIPSIDGIPYTVKQGDTPESIADTYKISLEKLARINTLTDNTVKPASIIFLPDAKLDWATLQEINGDLFQKPLRQHFSISSRYGWRDNPFRPGERSFHNGIDMSAPRGTPVYASLTGKVVVTGFSKTYGNYVIISHHSGYQTLYGHLHTISTSMGAIVSPSSQIGLVGNTGMSTGPHLHFTIFKNGATQNPAALWN